MSRRRAPTDACFPFCCAADTIADYPLHDRKGILRAEVMPPADDVAFA
ncbi:MAG: hypothetical protein AAGD11_10320 [Planctomycetota bacterium]